MTLEAASSVVAGTLAPPIPAPAMSVSGLRIRAGRKELLHGVDARFPSQRVTAIIGPTGCGKSTLLRALNRLHDDVPGIGVSGGTVRLGDRDIYRDVEGVRELRRRVGMVFQRPNPFSQSILENVTIGPKVHRLVPRKRLRRLALEKLEQVGLLEAVKDRLGGSPFSLSGGQQQLLCIARALAVDPGVILLDEPTSSLDPRTTTNIERLITSLRQEVTVIMVSHNLGQVRRVADYVLFLFAGSSVELNDAQTFFDNPSDPSSREYVSGEVGKA
ncbi:MAG: phosphate ABC transporter ATP-binding protein [Candidatus Dormibacteraceae bacterium]